MRNSAARELVAEAERRKVGKCVPGYGDNKQWCNVDDIHMLIDADADILWLNERMIGGYAHEVRLRGYRFQTVTRRPVPSFRRYTSDQ